jgi:hypothetical protein
MSNPVIRCQFCIEEKPKRAPSTKTTPSQTDTKQLGHPIHGKRRWQQTRIHLDFKKLSTRVWSHYPKTNHKLLKVPTNSVHINTLGGDGPKEGKK